MYEKSGETEKARENYKKAINYGKRPWEVYVALARLELENDNTIQAEDLLLTLNDNYPYHPKSYILLGTLKMMADDPTAALEYYQKASDLDIHSKEADIGNDFALWRLGRMPSPQFILLHPEVFKDVEPEEETLAESIILYLSKAPKNPGALEVILK